MRIDMFSSTSSRCVLLERAQTGAQNSTVEYHRASAELHRVWPLAPQLEPASLPRRLLRVPTCRHVLHSCLLNHTYIFHFFFFLIYNFFFFFYFFFFFFFLFF